MLRIKDVLRCKGFSWAGEHYLYAFPVHLFVKPSILKQSCCYCKWWLPLLLYCMGSPHLKVVNCLLHISCCTLVVSEFVVTSSEANRGTHTRAGLASSIFRPVARITTAFPVSSHTVHYAYYCFLSWLLTWTDGQGATQLFVHFSSQFITNST